MEATAPAYQAELVPMHGTKYEHPEGPRVPAVEHGTAAHAASEPPPRDYIVWSLCSLVYFNPLCLGLGAVYFSIKSRDRRQAGDLQTAREYGSTARCLNMVALVLQIILAVSIIAISVSMRSQPFC